MVIRDDGAGDGWLAIGQASHAWLSGQLARAWGGAALPSPEPREAVALAAEQHDVGMAEWDLRPTLDPAMGRATAFTAMPRELHLALWDAAARKLETQSRYAALLVSMHGTALYEMRDLDELEETDAYAVRGYLSAQRELQERLGAGLARDGLRRNQRLIWVWDFLSLGLCLGWDGRSLDGITIGEGTLEPWPLREDRVVLRAEGRRVEGRFEDEEEMRAALAEAPWVEMRFELARR